MTIDRVIAETSAGSLIGGLKWRAVTGKPSTKALKEARAATESTHFTLLKARGQAIYGLFSLRASEENKKLPKTMVSAAAVFASLVGEEFPAAVLIIHLPASEGDKEERIYNVVLEDGVPVVDTITNASGARDNLGDQDRRIFTDDDVAYPTSERIDLAWLAQGITKDARIQRVPVDPVPLIVVTLLLLSAGAGYQWWEAKRKAEKARAAAAAAAAADPTPRYLESLTAQRVRMASDRKAFADLTQQIFAIPVVVPGWKLGEAECEANSGSCRFRWLRTGGTFDTLKAALPSHKLVYASNAGATVPSLDEAFTTIAAEVPRTDFLARESQLPSMPDMQAAHMPLYQVWKTAGIAVDIKEAALWPAAPGVPVGFKHPKAIARGAVGVREVQAPFVLEAIRTAPPNVSWEAVRAVVGEGRDPKSLVIFDLKGFYYVKQSSPKP